MQCQLEEYWGEIGNYIINAAEKAYNTVKKGVEYITDKFLPGRIHKGDDYEFDWDNDDDNDNNDDNDQNDKNNNNNDDNDNNDDDDRDWKDWWDRRRDNDKKKDNHGIFDNIKKNIENVIKSAVDAALSDFVKGLFDIPKDVVNYFVNMIKNLINMAKNLINSISGELGIFAPIAWLLLFVLVVLVAWGIVKFIIGLLIPT